MRLAEALGQHRVPVITIPSRTKSVGVIGSPLGACAGAIGRLLADIQFERPAARVFRWGLVLDPHQARSMLGLARIAAGPG